LPIGDLPRKHNIHLKEEVRQWWAIVLSEYEKLKEEIKRQRDAFVVGFWTGYELTGILEDKSSDIKQQKNVPLI